MQVSYEILGEILLYSVGFGIFYYLLYRSYIYSIVDPLFIFVFSTAFASVLVIEVVEDVNNIIHYFVCQLSVWAGFVLVQKRMTMRNLEISKVVNGQFSDVVLLRYVVYTLYFIYFFSILLFLQSKGFALFADNPSEAKITNFQEGFGIFRKINWAVGGVAGTGLMYLYLVESKRNYLILLLILIALSALEGSKGALVRYAVTLGFLIYHPKFRVKKKLIKLIQKIQFPAIASIFLISFIVLFKENASAETAIFAFLRRLLYGADALLYFYHPINVDYFSRFSIWDYPEYIINPILGFLRLAPYQEAFGNIMVDNALPEGVTLDVLIGPNTSFYTEGRVFFGYYGAFFYSFLLGAFSSYIRALYFTLNKSSAFFFVFLGTIFQFSNAILVDLKFFITQSFDVILLVIPVYIVVSLLVRRKFVLRAIEFIRPSQN
ncbi:hypothetical protein GCM10028807_60200 [Spirosoma daeguense]